MKIKTALISAYFKDGMVEFARDLIALGVQTIYGSKGTAAHLNMAGIGIEVIDVATIVGEPILGHSVVTLSREVHAALLAIYINASDLEELARLHLPPIDLVCVDLYPLEEAIRDKDSTLAKVLKNMDIGGPTMLSSGSKGQRVVICDPKDRRAVIDWMRAGQPDEDAFIEAFAAKADFVVSKYRMLTAAYRSYGMFDAMFGIKAAEGKGENGSQSPSEFFDHGTEDSLAHSRFTQIEGAAPGHVNRRDIDRLLQTMTHAAAAFDLNLGTVPYLAVGVKHGNACGAAFGDSKEEVLKKMLEGDLQAIFGGFIMTNFEIDVVCTEILMRHKIPADVKRRKLDGIVAPSFGSIARAMLKSKSGTCRLFVNRALSSLGMNSLDAGLLRIPVRGGYLKQKNYGFVMDLRESNEHLKIYGEHDMKRVESMLLAYAVCATSNSNTITIVGDEMLKGNGVGQQSRVRAGRLAVFNATDSGHDVSGSVACSDSFFPFPDGPELLIKAGVKMIFATSGSRNDLLTIDICEKNGVTLLMMPDEIARMFFGH